MAAESKLRIVFEGTTGDVLKVFEKISAGANKMATKISTASSKANAAMERVGAGLGTKFTTSLQQAGAAVTRFGLLLGGSFVAAAGLATREINRFNDALVEIGTLGVPTEDIERYRDALLDISTGTSESLVNLTAGLYQTISAGVTDAAEATKLLDVAQRSAIAGVTDTATAVDALTIVFNSYSSELKTTEERLALVTRIGDVLNRTVDLGRTKFGELASSIGLVAGTASSAGLSIDELGGTLAVLTRTLPNTAIATTALNNLLLKMVAPSDAAREAAEEMGIELGEAALKSVGFSAKIAEIIEVTGGSQEKMKLLVEDLRALRAITSISAQGIDSLNIAITEMGGATGSVDADFKVMMETIGNRLGKLKNNILESFVKVFDQALPEIKKALGNIEEFFAANGREIAESLGSVLKGLMGFVRFLVENRGKILTIIKLIFAKKVMDLFLGGIVAVTGGMGRLGNAFTVMGDRAKFSFGAVTAGVTKTKPSIKSMAGAVGTIGFAFMALVPIVIAAVDAISTELNRAEKLAKDTAKKVLDAVTETRDLIFTTRRETFEELRALAEEDTEAAIEAASERLRVETDTANTIVGRKKVIERELRRVDDMRVEAERKRMLSVLKLVDDEERDRLDTLEASLTAQLEAEKTRARLIGETILGLNEFIRDQARKIGKERTDAIRLHSGIFLIEADKIEGKAKSTGKSISGSFKKSARESGAAFDRMFDSLSAAMTASAEMMVKNSELALKPFTNVFVGEIEKFRDLVADLPDIAALEFAKLGPVEIEMLEKLADQFAKGTERARKKISEELEKGFRTLGLIRPVQEIEVRIRYTTEGGEREAGQDIREVITDNVQDGARQGLEDGAAQAAPSMGARIGAAIGGVFGDLALALGRKVAEVARAVGNFFLDFFVRGPFEELKNLLQLAMQTSPVGDDGESFADTLDEVLQGFVDSITNLVANLPTLIDSLIDFLPKLVGALVDAVPEIIDSLLDGVPRLIDAVIELIPQLTQGFAEQMEPIIAMLEEEMPRLGEALADGLRTSINEFLESDWLPRIVEVLLELVGTIVSTLIDTISNSLSQLLRDIPDIIISIVDLIVGDLIPALIAEIPEIIQALVDGLPDFLQELIGGLGDLLFGDDGLITKIIDMLIGEDGLIGRLPELIVELVGGIIKAIPDIVTNLVSSIIGMIPTIITSFVQGFPGMITSAFELIFARIPELVFEIIKGLLASIGQLGEQIGEEIFGERGRTAGRVIGGILTGGVSEIGRAISNAHSGGLIGPVGVQQFQFGGLVDAINAGTRRAAASMPGPDNVPILAQQGEFVMNRDATQRVGPDTLAAINAGEDIVGDTHFHFLPGSQIVVDATRSLDAQMADLIGRGAGRVGGVMRRRSSPPIRRGQKFNQESDPT